MNEFSTFVGLDVHQRTVVAAMLVRTTGEVKRATFERGDRGLKKLVRWLQGEGEGPVKCCYEAGSAGFVLERQLEAEGLMCEVIAPSLILERVGDRRKNDRRDALKLAQQLASGLLTAVHPPTTEDEAARALVRARDDARGVLHQAKQRVLKFLDQQGLPYQGKNWTLKHQHWLRQLQLPVALAQTVLGENLLAVEEAQQRLARLDGYLAELAATERYAAAVGRLRCLRGIETLTAMAILTELYEFWRFPTPRALMGFLGLIPGERSSGERQQSTGLTRTGNGLVRRLLTEAAWHYVRAPVQLRGALAQRQVGQPAEAVALAHQAMVRLKQRYQHLVARGKLPKVAVMATARELAGFIWAILQPWAEPQRPTWAA